VRRRLRWRVSYNGDAIAGAALRGHDGFAAEGAWTVGRYDVSDERHEQGDATPDAGAETTVAGPVSGMRAGRFSRRQLMAAPTGLGLRRGAPRR
jgi:hypothetical protein